MLRNEARQQAADLAAQAEKRTARRVCFWPVSAGAQEQLRAAKLPAGQNEQAQAFSAEA